MKNYENRNKKLKYSESDLDKDIKKALQKIFELKGVYPKDFKNFFEFADAWVKAPPIR